MTDQESKSSTEQASPAGSSEPSIFKAIIAIGVMGEDEDVERFTALWVIDSERRAHRIVEKLGIPVQLLPLPEETDEEAV